MPRDGGYEPRPFAAGGGHELGRRPSGHRRVCIHTRLVDGTAPTAPVAPTSRGDVPAQASAAYRTEMEHEIRLDHNARLVVTIDDDMPAYTSAVLHQDHGVRELWTFQAVDHFSCDVDGEMLIVDVRDSRVIATWRTRVIHSHFRSSVWVFPALCAGGGLFLLGRSTGDGVGIAISGVGLLTIMAVLASVYGRR